jgi:hypothetical protein
MADRPRFLKRCCHLSIPPKGGRPTSRRCFVRVAPRFHAPEDDQALCIGGSVDTDDSCSADERGAATFVAKVLDDLGFI